MVTKMTLRLPDRVAKQLRERSREKGHSLNDVAVRALERGLAQSGGDGDDDDEWWRALGDLVERPPIGKFDPEELRQLHAMLPPTTRSIDKDLNWVRQDRGL